MAFCHSCGHPLPAPERACARCGAPYHAKRAKKQTVALLLASTLGLFGAHRFYLGHRNAGLLYLLFCWTGVPALLALVESIVFACTDRQTWAARYNQGRAGHPVPRAIAVAAVGLPLILLALFIVSILFPELDF